MNFYFFFKDRGHEFLLIFRAQGHRFLSMFFSKTWIVTIFFQWHGFLSTPIPRTNYEDIYQYFFQGFKRLIYIVINSSAKYLDCYVNLFKIQGKILILNGNFQRLSEVPWWASKMDFYEHSFKDVNFYWFFFRESRTWISFNVFCINIFF